MDILEGVVDHLQNTVSISDSGNHSRTTTYIALFRLNGQPVQFRCPRPIPFADGDRLRVAGHRRAGSLRAFGCHDLTTGQALNSGVWGNFFMIFLVLLVGAVIARGSAGLLHEWAWLIFAGFGVAALCYLYMAGRNFVASRQVR